MVGGLIYYHRIVSYNYFLSTVEHEGACITSDSQTTPNSNKEIH